MISSEWRARLAYVFLSMFVAWHTVAMVLAPAPDNSVVTIALRKVFQPYLSVLRMDNPWDFFAPNVERGTVLRYTIEDSEGKQHTFTPTEGLSWFHPSYFWARSRYNAVLESPDDFAEAYAAMACRQHAALHPVSITLLEVEMGEFWVDEHLSGKRPTDPEFLTVNTLQHLTCPNP